MAYLLAWSLLIGSNLITGMAMFRTIEECEEAKQVILSHKNVDKRSYIECRLIENDKPIQSHLWLEARRNEI